MLQILKSHKKVSIVAAIAFLVSSILFVLPWGQKGYSYPELTRAEVTETVSQYLQETSEFSAEEINLIETNVDMGLGRHIEFELNDEEYELVFEHIPVYTIQATLDNSFSVVHVHPLENRVVGAENIAIPMNHDESVETFIHKIFHSEYKLVEEVESVSTGLIQLNDVFLSKYTDRTQFTFEGPFDYEGIKEIITVDVGTSIEDDSKFVLGFMHSAEVAPQYMVSDETTREIISALIVLLILGVLVFASLIHFIVKASKRKVAFKLPLAITIFLSVFGLIFGYVYTGKIDGWSWMEVGLSAWLVFFILAMTIPVDTHFLKGKPFRDKLTQSLIGMKSPILLGLLLAIISHPLSEIFFMIADRIGGAWFSPVTFYEIYLIENVWLLPFFVLSIGITAAIMEETVFRRYLASAMDRIHPIFAVLVTSFLWAVLHMGYDVFPWYLRIIELTLIIGPFLYWVYKKYGFLTVIYCHYFYNSLLISMSLLSFRVDVAIVSFLLTLSPLLLFFYKRKKIALEVATDEEIEQSVI
ncbi:CPBP family intramembrane glutamic endopeptidase [Bacillus alkalicellulosilyticus]|uniref:CPBP family intramembrane glutamic endopeptidase n=1 Tax=Alkalihalobacterium alkalicellulosilyticum TaxID=1912214 RepID=UPI000996A58C|nr:type II CAAX endopeptidase family protein [Bacillus alkalicellulosilyticus]